MKRSSVLANADCRAPAEPTRLAIAKRKSEISAHVLEPFALDDSGDGCELGGERMRRESYQKGFEDGLEQAGQRKTVHVADALARAVEKLQAEFTPAAQQRRRAEILDLSLAVARRVVMGEMKTNPGVVGEVVSSLLAEAEGRKVFAVRLHPDDVERLKRSPEAVARLEKAKIALQSSPEIKPGDVILETGFGRLDARLETRLDEMAAALLGNQDPDAGAPALNHSEIGNRESEGEK